MKSPFGRALLLSSVLMILTGCATYEATVERGHNLKTLQRFFVISNLNDNHGLDHQIALALQSHGLKAEVGPLTMMPEETQAIVTYDDRWTWDFSDHLVDLRISLRDTRSEQDFASASFRAKIPVHKPTPDIVAQVVAELLAKK